MRGSAALLILILGPLPVSRAAGDAVVAVLASGSPYYRRGLEGFSSDYGGEVSTVRLDRENPAGGEGRVFAAFGGAAAAHEYPPGAFVATMLAPGSTDEPRGRERGRVKIAMVPAPGELLRLLRGLRPGLAVLGTMYCSDGAAQETGRLAEAAARGGIRFVRADACGPGGLPVVLRSFSAEGVSALWLPPDPLLITPETLERLRNFSRNNGVPFFVPTKALLSEGAAGAVFKDFKDAGAAAARFLNGRDWDQPGGRTVYLEGFEVRTAGDGSGGIK